MLRILRILASLVVLVVAIVLGVCVALNTGAGRAFAEKQINRFLGPQIVITGLAGHFPADIKLASLTLSDSKGIYATGLGLELRWIPRKLLQRDVYVSSLTAASLDVLRQPAPPKKKTSPKTTLPKFRLDVDLLAVSALHAGAPLAGENITLNVTGATHFADETHGNVLLNATTPDGSAQYHLAAGIDPETVVLRAQVAEPPDGLLGHFAGPQVQAPLAIDVSLHGPRDKAALVFNAALGNAKLSGTGTLGLNPAHPSADVVLHIPALTPFAAIAHQNIAGDTSLHLIVAHSSLALDGNVALTQAPGGVAKLVGSSGRLSLLANLHGKTVELQKLDVSGAQFAAAITGSVSQAAVALQTQIKLAQVSAISPGISGNIEADGTIIGPPKDFAVNARLTGNIRQRQIPSGPFSITIKAQHLPRTPMGTITGSGALEGRPLALDAAFARDANGAATLQLNSARWRSLDAKASLALAAGAKLPTGTANFKLGSLADFAAFSPVPLAGSVAANFTHAANGTFNLALVAKNLAVSPSLGAINATLNANGPQKALAIRAQASVAKLLTAPARLALAGVLNLENRSASLTVFSADWRRLNVALLSPAQISTKPGIAVRHLALGLSGGHIALDGTLTPKLDASLTLQNLPASLAKTFVPSVDASGTLSGSATLTGSRASPSGRIALAASNIQLHSGPAEALPAANLTATAIIQGKATNIAAKLTAGANVSLAASGAVPLTKSGMADLNLTGRTDLRLLDPILAAQGSVVRGLVALNVTLTGNAASPRADGGVTLTGGSVENIGSGLNLTHITANLRALGKTIDLQSFQASAGKGTISGDGIINLAAAAIPIELSLNAHQASPISSDIVTETIDAALNIKGAVRGKMALGGTVKIDNANINIPKSLPPSVANLTIINAGEPPPPPPAPRPPIAIDLEITAPNKIFVRGDGLFAELGGKFRITGTAAHPNPEGGFTLIRGDFSLAGTALQFTQGTVSFNGDGFMPSLDLEATSTAANNTTATLIVGGTAAKPTITLTSSPPLPSDEILAQLLFHESASSLSPFQAASLAAALAQLSGVGSGINPLDKVRNALGLDQLSLGGSGNGPPSLQAGRYVAPGVYVGAAQATNGQGTSANVQINLYKGLKLQTSTGASSTGTGDASSVGLSYQFNY